MKRLLVFALALLSSAIGSFAQTASLTASTPNYSTGGGFVTLTGGIDYSTVAGPTALGFKINLPPGWKLAPLNPGDPDLSPGWIGGTNTQFSTVPTSGMNTLDFSYSSFPLNRVSFVAVVSYPENETGTKTITASAIYRAPGTSATDVTLSVGSLNFASAADATPAITTPPGSQTVNAGQSVTFSVVATGNPGVTYQWRNGTVELAGAYGPSYTIPNVTASLNGANYNVVVSNALNQVTSTNATLTVRFISTSGGVSPTSGGQGAVVTINGSGFTGATGVRFNGVDAASFTVVSNTQITAVVPTFATSGQIAVTLADASVVTSTASFTVLEGPRLVNMSQRSASTGGEAAVMQSFSIHGTTSKSVLIRAVGPTLGSFGVSGFMVDPFLSIYDGTGTQITSNNDWDSSLSSSFGTVGAFNLNAGSKDAAILITLQPGTYTARVTGVGNTTGIVLIEAYEMDTTKRIPYMSTRSQVGTGADIKATGFVLGGAGTTGNKTVLIRAVGAGLGVAGALLNPTLTVFSGSTTVAVNDNWGSSANVADINAATAAVGAMPLAANDSAVLLSLPAGPYTVQVSGVGNTTGIALTEVFLVDTFLPAAFPPALVGTLHPQTPPLNGTVMFAAPFVGKPAPALQWQKSPTAAGSFVNLDGQTSVALTLPNVTSAANGFYRVALTNSAAGGTTVNSAAAEVGVAKAPQTIAFPAITPATFSLGGTVTISATATSGLPVSFASSNATVATVGTPVLQPNGSTTVALTMGDVGSTTITASQAGNGDFAGAAIATQLLVVNKGTATIVLNGLTATFDGNPKVVTATTTPGPLPVDITYNGSATPPTNASSYTVVATVNHSHYQGTRTDTLLIAKADQTISFGPLAAKTFGDAPFNVAATATSGGTVQFASSNNAVATISGNTVTIVGGGTAKITASQPGGTNYNAAPAVEQDLVVAKAAQTLAFGALANKTFGDAPFTVTASASSTLAPSFAIVSGPATIAGSTVTLTGAGTVVVRALQGGNSNFEAAPSIDQSFTVAKADQTIAFNLATAYSLDQSPIALSATASSTLGITFSLANPSSGTVATLSGSTLTLVNIGTIDVIASQPGNANFNAASITRTITVSAQSQTLTFAAAQLPAKTFGNPAFTITASSNRAGYTVIFTSSNPGVATVGAGTLNGSTTTATVSIVGAGSTTITATQPGDANTGPATPIGHVLTVSQAAATVTLGSLAQTYTGTSRVATATTIPAGLTVDFTYNGNATAPTNVGTYAVVGTINSPNYTGSASGNLVIGKADQTITFAGTELAGKTFGNGPFTVSATSDSSLAVALASSNTSVATVSGNTITILTGGTTTITATQTGNVNYNAAAPVARTLTIAQALATVTLSDLTHTYNGAVKGAGATTAPVAGLNVSFTYTGTASATTAPTNVGNYGVTATINDARYQGSASGTITISKADQVVDFAALASKPFNDPDFALTAISRRVGDNQPTGLVIGYLSSDTNVAAIVNGNMVDLKNQGSTTITASQAGDSNYNSATSVAQTLLVQAAGQTITFAGTELAGKKFGDGNITLAAESRANSDNTLTGLTVIFASDNAAVATISGNTLTIVGAGTANITASQAGNSNFAAASPVPRVLAVAKAPATISLGSLAQVYNGSPRAATATTTPVPLTVAFTYTPAAGSPSATAPTNAGTYAVTATVTGSTPPESNYTGSITGSLVIAKAPQGIAFADILSPKLVNAGSFSLTATSDSTLPVSFTSSNPSVASVVGNVVTINALGSTTLTAKQAGNDNYLPAPDFPQTLVVNPIAPVITSHPPLAQSTVVGSNFLFGPVTLNALSAPVTFSLSSTPAGLSGLTVNPNTGNISGVPAGTPGTYNLTLTATNATAADSKTITLTLLPPAPVITSAAATSVVAGSAINYTVMATPATGVTLTTGTLPGWLTFNATSGVFSGTPTVPETVTVQITASNATGSAVLPFVITVVPNPNAPVYAGTLAPSGTAGTAFSFATNFGSGAGSTTYNLTGPSGMVISGTGVISWPSPVVGSHTVTVIATRASLSTTVTLTVTINPAATAPVVTITGGNVRSATFGAAFGPVAITATGGPTSFTIGALPAGLTIGGTATAPTIAGSPSALGTTNVAISATNSAGTGPAAILTIVVNPHAQAPLITSAPAVLGQVGVPLNYPLSATPAIATTYGSTGAMPPGVGLASGIVSGTPTAAGTYHAFFAGTNANGPGLALEVTFVISPAASVPVVTSNGSAQAQVGQAFNYAIAATNSPTSFGAANLPAGLSVNPNTGVISGVPSTATAPGTPANVALTASNTSGTSNAKSLLITVVPAPATPVITSGGSANARVGVAFAYQATASEGPTSFVAIGLPPGLSLTPATGAIAGTPTTAGTYAVTLSAANAAGLGAGSPLALSVAPALTAPAITSPASAAGQVGVAFSYLTVATPGTITGYGIGGSLPVGLSFNSATGVITGSPTQPGLFNVTLTATSDGGTSLPQTLVIQIAPAANVPVITSAGSATGTAGTAFSYQITATNSPHTSLDAVNLPAGLAVNPFTGVISGTPTAVGTTAASLVGTNAAGTGPTADLTLDVLPALAAPLVTGANNLSAQVGVAFTHQITATNSPTAFEVVGAPAWMTVNTATGALAGTPTMPGNLAVSFLASNASGSSGPRLITLTIAAAPNTPGITSPRIAAGTTGVVFTGYLITAAPAATSYLAVGLPPGLTLNSGTGAITGTPTSSGTYPVTVSASNANGAGTPVTVVFTIERSISFGL